MLQLLGLLKQVLHLMSQQLCPDGEAVHEAEAVLVGVLHCVVVTVFGACAKS